MEQTISNVSVKRVMTVQANSGYGAVFLEKSILVDGFTKVFLPLATGLLTFG
jgi:hypothetical protein